MLSSSRVRMAAGRCVLRSNRMMNVVPPSAKGNRRQRLLAELLGSRGVDIFGSFMAFTSSHGEARSSSRSCAASRMPDIGWLPLLVGDEAERRQHGLGVLQLIDRVGIFLIAVPVGARPALGEIPGHRECRVSQEARLAAGSEGLPRLPEFRVALDGEALHSAQRIGAAFRGHGLLDETIAASLSQGRLLRNHRQHNAAIHNAYFMGLPPSLYR